MKWSNLSLLFVLSQLLALQKKLKQHEEVEDVTVRLNKLNEIRGGTPKHPVGGGASSSMAVTGSGVTSSSGGGASAAIWKKLKGGKKKKQRNLTAPEISTEEVAEAALQNSAQNNLSMAKSREGGKSEADTSKKESGGKDAAGKGKGIFGRKQTKEKSSPTNRDAKRKSRDVSEMTKKGEVVLRNDLVMTPSDSDDVGLSQRSSHSLSQTSTTAADLMGSPALSNRPTNPIVLEVLDLSQSSGKHPTSSSSSALLPQTNFNEDHCSTQSSSDTGALNPASQTEAEPLNSQEESRNSLAWDRESGVAKGLGRQEEEDTEYNDNFHSYLQGSAELYKEFGSTQHKLNLKKVQEFLESSKEMNPVDLRLLQDWDGWIAAVREIV